MKIRYDNNCVLFNVLNIGDVFRDDGAIFMRTNGNGMAIALSDSTDYPVASEIEFGSYDEVELLDCELVIK